MFGKDMHKRKLDEIHRISTKHAVGNTDLRFKSKLLPFDSLGPNYKNGLKKRANDQNSYSHYLTAQHGLHHKSPRL